MISCSLEGSVRLMTLSTARLGDITRSKYLGVLGSGRAASRLIRNYSPYTSSVAGEPWTIPPRVKFTPSRFSAMQWYWPRSLYSRLIINKVELPVENWISPDGFSSCESQMEKKTRQPYSMSSCPVAIVWFNISWWKAKHSPLLTQTNTDVTLMVIHVANVLHTRHAFKSRFKLLWDQTGTWRMVQSNMKFTSSEFFFVQWNQLGSEDLPPPLVLLKISYEHIPHLLSRPCTMLFELLGLHTCCSQIELLLFLMT